MKIGDRVRIRPGVASIFVVVGIDDERAVVESAGTEPGKYPFSAPIADLVSE